MKNFVIYFLFYFVCTGNLLASSDDFNLSGLSSLDELPILHEGRIKPLRAFSEIIAKKSFQKNNFKGYDSTEFLLNLLFRPDESYLLKFYKIKDKNVLDALSLEKDKEDYYSLSELATAIQKTLPVFNKILVLPTSERDFLQSSLFSIYQNVGELYYLIRSMTLIIPRFEIKSPYYAKILGVEPSHPISYMDLYKKYDEFKMIIDEIHKKKIGESGEEDLEILKIGFTLDTIENDKESDVFKILPLSFSDSELGSPWQILRNGQGTPLTGEILDLWQKLMKGYLGNDSALFNSSATTLLKLYTEKVSLPHYDPFKMKLEVWYLRLKLFNMSLVFLVLALLFWGVSKKSLDKFFSNISFSFLLLAGLSQFSGIVLRCLIMERPPVTSLYESIIFVSLVMVISALIYYLFSKNKMGIFIGSLSGIFLIILSKGYEKDGDTFSSLIAVLNTNFWLAIHVMTITIGYGLVLLTSFFAHQFLFKYLKNQMKLSNQDLNSDLSLIRKLINLAFFFSVSGTVLGGFWADQSWGRFWGWDPKENGALLIVLWLIFLLHGRMTDILNHLRFLSLAAYSSVMVALAWFGVNLLSVGLHSYGFTNHVAFNLFLFILVETILIVSLYFMNNKKKTLLVRE